MATTVVISVEMGTDSELVTIRKSNSSKPMVVGLLGVDTDDNGTPIKVYLRSKIHGLSESCIYEGWEPSGAITTILTRV